MDLSSVLTKTINKFTEGSSYERIEKGFFTYKDSFDSDGKMIDPSKAMKKAAQNLHSDITLIFAQSAQNSVGIICEFINKGYIDLFRKIKDNIKDKIYLEYYPFMIASIRGKNIDLCIELINDNGIYEWHLNCFIRQAIDTGRLDIVKLFVEKDKDKTVKLSLQHATPEIREYLESFYER